MLNVNVKHEPLPASHERTSVPDATRDTLSCTPNNRQKKTFCIEWLGQTIASLCWIGSVLTYGINSGGDWLQLCAASAWLMANIAPAVTAKST